MDNDQDKRPEQDDGKVRLAEQSDGTPPQEEAPNEAETAVSGPTGTESPAPRRKKLRWFWIIVALYMVILLGVSGYLQLSLWWFLESSQAEMDQLAEEQAALAAQQAYEKAMHQAPQLAFEDWRGGLTADYWTGLWYAKAPSDLDVREAVQDFMAERFAPDAITAYKATEYTDETPVYVLKNGEDALARVTLTGNALDWSVSEVELLIEGSCSASVTVADRCHVYCNGRELGGEYTEDAESHFHYEPLKGALKGAVTWVSYSVEGLLLEPELTVEPPEGCGLIWSEEGDCLLSPAEDTDTYANKAVTFVKAYLSYYMNGRRNPRENMNKVLNCLTPGTQAYQDIRDTYIGVYYAVAYSDIDTSKTAAGDVFFWADNCFSVDVTYDADCTRSGVHVDYADATMRIYFLQTGSGYVISHFEAL